MNLRRALIGLATISLLATPSLAQRREEGHVPAGGGHAGGPAGGVAHGAPGAVHAPQIFHGGPRGPAQWSEFHHDTAPARVTPHRFGATNFPRPGSWNGDIHRFDIGRWQGGGWQHVVHGGRLGWWWVVGPDWYYYDEPVYPYPDLYTPFGQAMGWWYWCDPYQEYYPFVTTCPVPWESVMPRD